MKSNTLKFFIIATFFFSCTNTTFQQSEKVKPGMNMAQVVQAIGVPDTVLPSYPADNFFSFRWNITEDGSDNFYVIFSTTDSLVKQVKNGK